MIYGSSACHSVRPIPKTVFVRSNTLSQEQRVSFTKRTCLGDAPTPILSTKVARFNTSAYVSQNTFFAGSHIVRLKKFGRRSERWLQECNMCHKHGVLTTAFRFLLASTNVNTTKFSDVAIWLSRWSLSYNSISLYFAQLFRRFRRAAKIRGELPESSIRGELPESQIRGELPIIWPYGRSNKRRASGEFLKSSSRCSFSGNIKCLPGSCAGFFLTSLAAWYIFTKRWY